MPYLKKQHLNTLKTVASMLEKNYKPNNVHLIILKSIILENDPDYNFDENKYRRTNTKK